MILIDTNVFSELTRSRPAPRVIDWMDRQADPVLCAPVVGELWFGVANLPEGRRRSLLAGAVETMILTMFANRVLTYGAPAARHFGDVCAERRAMGEPIGQIDAQIAAIAREHDIPLATRDVHDFAHLGLTIINPFDA